MNHAIQTVICGTAVTLVLQDGFFRHSTYSVPPHRHRCCEIHAVYGGEVGYTVEGEAYRVQSGDLLMIPGMIKHSCEGALEGTLHCSFMLDIQPERTVKVSVPEAMLHRLTEAARAAEESGNYREAVGCISFLFSVLFEGVRIDASPLRDDAMIISDYIEKNYAGDPTLAALSRELNLSVKQTARLVVRYMGGSFWEEITKRRMETAELLLSEGQMSKRQISEYVGYRSYSGFYKAWEKHREESR